MWTKAHDEVRHLIRKKEVDDAKLKEAIAKLDENQIDAFHVHRYHTTSCRYRAVPISGIVASKEMP